mgnify:CR=1 FL=1
MSSTKRIVQRLLLAAVAVGLVGISACAQAPKPKELQELERILGEKGANKVKEIPGAGKYYEKSRKLRRASLDEWEENDIEEARHYAIRGKIAYRTAEAISRQAKAKERFEAADSKVRKVNPRVQTLAQQRNKLQNEVQQLHQKVQAAQQRQAAQRKKRIAAQSGSSDDKDAKLEAQNKIRRAIDAKQEALDVKANQYAKASFNKANNQLKSAQSLMASSPDSMDEVVASAEGAKKAFEKAARDAKPKYDEEKAKQNPMKRLSSLKEKLTYNFGDRNVESVGRGVTVVVPGLFSAGSETVRSDKRGDLDTVADLAKKFDEFELSIDGFTRKGNATENLAISQVRAKRVRDYLKGKGVSEDRMSTSGHGQGQIRYQGSPSKNDRVEITFRL